MSNHPLRPPDPNSLLLQRFLSVHHIDKNLAPVDLLTRVATAFASVPYENLTKIIKAAQTGRPDEARRWPAEVLSGHREFGTGGTCFALTSTMVHLVRALGFEAEPILADRRYGPDTHSALLVWIDGSPHLLDPGYLIVKPLPLPDLGAVQIPTPFNEILLTVKDRGNKIDLHTVHQKQSTYRLTFKTPPVDAGEFLRAWDISFGSDLLRYPVLTRVMDGQQLYLQKNFFLTRSHSATQRAELPPDRLIQEIAARFGVAPQITAHALRLLK